MVQLYQISEKSINKHWHIVNINNTIANVFKANTIANVFKATPFIAFCKNLLRQIIGTNTAKNRQPKTSEG